MSSFKTPEQILSGSDTPPVTLAPAADLFEQRARRLETLAHGHPLGPWLGLMGELSHAQHLASQQLLVGTLPNSGAWPLDSRALSLPAPWKDVLGTLITQLHPLAPAPVRGILDGLRQHTDLDTLARQVLAGDVPSAQQGAAPFISAALQVCWTRMASQLESAPAATEDKTLCPCCGTPAVAAVVRIGNGLAGLRYLHCPLCSTEWNVMRARCTSCDTVHEVAQHRLEAPAQAPWQAAAAESCDDCGSYRKVFYLDKDPFADPVADDLATLALDVMMGEAGYGRSGANPFLLVAAD
jgi:FdhE protein